MDHQDHLKTEKDLKYQQPLERKNNWSILGQPLNKIISSGFFKNVFDEAKTEKNSSMEQNKEKQTLGGDHIFCEDSSSQGDLDADLALLPDSVKSAHTEEFLPHMHLIVDFLLCQIFSCFLIYNFC